jgi:Polyketide cyclase / dehydrase and lipid transport
MKFLCRSLRIICVLSFMASTATSAAPTAEPSMTRAAPPGRAALSVAQHKQLAGGEVVVLDVLPPGAARGSQGGTAVGLVHASPDVVWRVLVDYPRHSGLYPRVVKAEILESDTDRSLVRYIVGVGPFAFGFHVNNYPDAARRRIVWRLEQDRPNDLFTESSGYWQIDHDVDAVVLTYAMAARTVLPSFLTRGAEREGLVETLKAVRRRAEEQPTVY